MNHLKLFENINYEEFKQITKSDFDEKFGKRTYLDDIGSRIIKALKDVLKGFRIPSEFNFDVSDDKKVLTLRARTPVKTSINSRKPMMKIILHDNYFYVATRNDRKCYKCDDVVGLKEVLLILLRERFTKSGDPKSIKHDILWHIDRITNTEDLQKLENFLMEMGEYKIGGGRYS